MAPASIRLHIIALFIPCGNPAGMTCYHNTTVDIATVTKSSYVISWSSEFCFVVSGYW